MITDVPGVRVGHWTGGRHRGHGGPRSRRAPSGSGEVRGGAPATRETALLDPLCTVEAGRRGRAVRRLRIRAGHGRRRDARALAEQGRGFPTRGGPVPIVPAAAIYDLPVLSDDPQAPTPGNPPGPEEGRAALADAQRQPPVALAVGAVGAGRGASVAKWRGGEHARAGGLGSASARDGDVVLGALGRGQRAGRRVRARRRDASSDRARPPTRQAFPTRPRSTRARTPRSRSSPPNARCTKLRVPPRWRRAPTTVWPGPSTRRTPGTTATSPSRWPPVRSSRTSTASACSPPRSRRRRFATRSRTLLGNPDVLGRCRAPARTSSVRILCRSRT